MKRIIIGLGVVIFLIAVYQLDLAYQRWRREYVYMDTCKKNGQSEAFCNCTWKGIKEGMTTAEWNNTPGVSEERIQQLVISSGFNCISLVDLNK